MNDLTLFDLSPNLVQVQKGKVRDEVNWQALDGYALLYTATEYGNNSGIRFAMTKEHAQLWCQQSESSGVVHGTRWAYFWTSVTNFIQCHWGIGKPVIVTKGIVDNGEWDDRIADAGLIKIDVTDFDRVFGPLGIDVRTGSIGGDADA